MSWKHNNNISDVVLCSTLLLWLLHCCYLAKPLMLLEHFSALAGEEGKKKNARQAVSDLRKLSFIVTDHGAPEVDRCPRGARQQAQRFSFLLFSLFFSFQLLLARPRPIYFSAVFIAVCVGRRGGSLALYCNLLSFASM